MSDHYDRYNGMEELLGTNLAQLGTDCISRQAAIDAMAELQGRAASKGELTGISKAWQKIKKLPSADEPSQVARDIARIVENEKDMRVIAQPEIIRCKDCKNWDTTWTNDFSPNYHYCPMVDGVRKEDWFCADAERRTDEQTKD